MDVNYLGTFNIARAASKYLKSLQKFTLASSVEIYGNQETLPLREYMAPNPASPYGVAKVAAETYIRYLSRGYGFPGIILRTANTYGRIHTDYFVIERIIHQMLMGKKEIQLGIPSSIRDFLYVDDELSAYMALIKNNTIKFGETFNTGTGFGISIADLFYLIKHKTGSNAEPIWNVNSPRPYEIRNLTVDYTKLYNATGWSPQYDLSSGLSKTVRKWSDMMSEVKIRLD
jgi:nucleoside-diphosphate-sugar epimerase